MKLESLKDLYLEQLKDLYSAETQLLDALPKMVDGASAPDLKQAFSEHLPGELLTRLAESHVNEEAFSS